MATYKLTCADCIEFNGSAELETIGAPLTTSAHDLPNVIKGPGKFEAESVYAIHFYHAMLDGFGTPCACESGDVFELETSDVIAFPMLADDLAQGNVVHICTSESGFVYCKILTRAELDAHESENTQAEDN